MVHADIPTSMQLKKKRCTLWKNYYTLYMHYAYQSPMPAYFPLTVLHQFPNKTYAKELKEAIAALQNEEGECVQNIEVQLIRA